MSEAPKNDMPDGFKWLPGSRRSPMQDYGELAARLGSPVVFDRRGDVIFMDDGSKGAGFWIFGYNGAGGALSVIAANSLISGYGLRLTSGNVSEGYAAVAKALAGLATESYGLELAFSLPTSFTTLMFDLQFTFDGVSHLAQIMYEYATGKFYYLNSSGGYTYIFTRFNLGVENDFIYTLKFCVDAVNYKYKRLTFDGIDHDLSNISLFNSGASAGNTVSVTVWFNCEALANKYMDLFISILTANEP